jgi:hypothetical protein
LSISSEELKVLKLLFSSCILKLGTGDLVEKLLSKISKDNFVV